MAGKSKVFRETRLQAEREGFKVLRAKVSGGSHVDLFLERAGQQQRVISPLSTGDRKAGMNHRAFLRRLARQMDQQARRP